MKVNVSLPENKEAFRWGMGAQEAFIQALYSDFFCCLFCFGTLATNLT